MTPAALFDILHRDGHVASSGVPPIDVSDVASPWYLRVLMGFMGWLGGMFVLGFFGALIAAFFSNFVGMVLLAIGLFAGSFAIYRTAPSNDFATQFALAASICAQVVATLAYGNAVGLGMDIMNAASFVAVMQIALVFAMPNFLHRMLSTMFAVIAMFIAAEKGLLVPVFSGVVAFAFVLLARAESTLVASGRMMFADAVINGLAVALLLPGAAYVGFLGNAPWMPFSLYTSIAFAMVLVGWVALSTGRLPVMQRTAALMGAIIYAAVTWRAPGLIASALVLLLAFGSGRRALTGFALFALVAYLSTYYYQMHMTLATKSMVLALSGASLLVMWWGHRTYFNGERA